MQRAVFAAIMLLLAVGAASAQDFPKAEIFGGYSLLRIGGDDVNSLLDAATLQAPQGVSTSKLFKRGFDASFTYNLKKHIGIEAAFQYNTNEIMEFNGVVEQFPGDTVGFRYNASIDANDLSFMVGPKFACRHYERFTPFVHVLFGMNRISVDPSLRIDGEDFTNQFTSETGIGKSSDTGFGLIAGGGIDVNVYKNIAVRPIQFDYLMGSHSERNFDLKLHNMKFSFGVVIKLGGK